MRSSRRSVARFTLAVALILVCAVVGPAAAQADVDFRAASADTAISSGTVSSLPVTIARPTGLTAGDVMLAVVRWQLGNSHTAPVYTPAAGWTELDVAESTGNSYGGSGLWWKRATAADVASSSFTFSRSWSTARQAIATGGISAFSGVVAAGSPIAWPADVPASRVAFGPCCSGSSPISFTRPSGTYATGSMAVSIASIRRYQATDTNAVNVSSISNGTLAFESPQTGNSIFGLNATMAYRAANASGQYPATHTEANLSANSHWSAWSVVLDPAPPCSVGGLSLAAPSSISFGSTALSGTNAIATTSTSIGVDDQSNPGSGWNLAINPSQFTNGSFQLPTTAVSVTGASQADAGGRCSAPTSTVTYPPLTLPAGSATKVYNAASGTGKGPTTVTLDLALAIPANARLGVYSSTWTITLAAGP